MIFPFVLLTILVAPIVAVALSMRDHHLMAPAIGTVGAGATVRGDRVLRGAPVAWRALLPLVGVEAKRLVRHPAAYVIGLPLVALGLWNVAWSGVNVYERTDVDLIVLVVPYAWGVLIASNLLTLRSRRWRSVELLATTPTPARSRTSAHLLATSGTVPVTIVILAVAVAVQRTSGRTFGAPRPWVLVTAVLIVIGGGCLGVAVARWLPRPAFGWVAVLATMVLQVNLGHMDPRWRWLHFTMNGGDGLNYHDIGPDLHAVHAAYLIGGILLVVAIALARDGIDRNVGVLGAVALVLVVITGAAQVVTPSSGALETYARRVEDPGADQACRRVGSVSYCADEDYLDLVPFWQEPVAGVLALVPTAAVPADLVVRQRPLIDVGPTLLPPVAERVDPAVAWPDDDEVSVSNQWALPSPEEARPPGQFQLALGYRTASRLLGLPPDAWWSASGSAPVLWTAVRLADPRTDDLVANPMTPCSAIGDGRAVVAALLAGLATPAAGAELRRRAGEVVAWDLGATPAVFDAVGTYLPGLPSTIPEQGSVLSGADLVAAATLLGRDEHEVTTVVAEHWDDLTVGRGSPPSTDEVLGWFGTEPMQASQVADATNPAPQPEPDAEDAPSIPVAGRPCSAGSS